MQLFNSKIQRLTVPLSENLTNLRDLILTIIITKIFFVLGIAYNFAKRLNLSFRYLCIHRVFKELYAIAVIALANHLLPFLPVAYYIPNLFIFLYIYFNLKFVLNFFSPNHNWCRRTDRENFQSYGIIISFNINRIIPIIRRLNCISA